MRRLGTLLVLAAWWGACTAGGGEADQAGSSATSVQEEEAAVVGAAGAYLEAIESGDFLGANELRCQPEYLEVQGLAQLELASDRLLGDLGGLAVSAADVAIGSDGRALAVITLAPSEADLVLRLEKGESGSWSVCGQLTHEGVDIRSRLGTQPQEPLRVGAPLADVFPVSGIDAYELTDSDVPPTEPDDADRRIVRRESQRYTGPADSPDVRIVVTEFEDVEAAAVEELRQGAGLVENSVAMLEVEGQNDRGVRYLASSKTFIQPSTVGPYWDAVWLLVDDYLVLISVGPIEVATADSIAEDVAKGILQQLARA